MEKIMSDVMIQLIISGSGVLLSIIGVLVILARKVSNGSVKGNGLNKSLQKQIDSGGEGTKTLATRFEDQVKGCNKLWLEAAEERGIIKGFMLEIRELLKRLQPQAACESEPRKRRRSKK